MPTKIKFHLRPKTKRKHIHFRPKNKNESHLIILVFFRLRTFTHHVSPTMRRHFFTFSLCLFFCLSYMKIKHLLCIIGGQHRQLIKALWQPPVGNYNYYPRRSRSAIGVDIVLTLDVCMFVCCMYVSALERKRLIGMT